MLPYRAVLLCGSLLVACTEAAPRVEPAPAPAPAPAKVEETKVEAPPQKPPPVEARAEPPAPVAAVAEVTLDSQVGVPACDDYVARYRACLEKVGEHEKQSHTTALLSQLKTWLVARNDAKLAPALAEECASAATAARATTRILGCVWREGDKPEPEMPRGGKNRPQPRGRGMVDPLDEL